MRFLVISGNPKNDGLCKSVEIEIMRGAADGGAQVETAQVGRMNACRVCGGGWGTCRSERRCAFGDDGFEEIQRKVREADAVCLITPVYWAEAAEGMKSFMDRLRRCEFGEKGALSGKPVLLVASPGGSGNGAIQCLDEMSRFCRHTSAEIFDHIAINRWNCDYKRQAAYCAAKAIAGGRKAGESLPGGE